MTLDQLKTQKNPAARKRALAITAAAQPGAASTLPRITPRAQPAASVTSSENTIKKTVQKTANTRKRSATKSRVPPVANMESINDANNFDFHQAKAEKPRKPRMLEEDGTFTDRAPVPGKAAKKEIDAWAEAQMRTNPDVAAMNNEDIELATPETIDGSEDGEDSDVASTACAHDEVFTFQ